MINQTGREAAFSAQDSALPIVQEAQDSKGKWRPIEFFLPATCGNSYNWLFLSDRSKWTFKTVSDQKGVKTIVRVRLLTGMGAIYSNEVDALVDPHRFELPPSCTIKEVDGIFRIAMKSSR